MEKYKHQEKREKERHYGWSQLEIEINGNLCAEHPVMTSDPCLSHSSYQSSIPNHNIKPNLIPIFQRTDSLSDLSS